MKTYKIILKEFPSKSNPHKSYTISMDSDGNLSCNYRAWINKSDLEAKRTGKRTCKHVRDIEASGFGSDTDGKFIIGKGKSAWDTKQVIFCKKYPDDCNICTARFVCWTQENPEFEISELEELGIVKK